MTPKLTKAKITSLNIFIAKETNVSIKKQMYQLGESTVKGE